MTDKGELFCLVDVAEGCAVVDGLVVVVFSGPAGSDGRPNRAPIRGGSSPVDRSTGFAEGPSGPLGTGSLAPPIELDGVSPVLATLDVVGVVDVVDALDVGDASVTSALGGGAFSEA